MTAEKPIKSTTRRHAVDVPQALIDKAEQGDSSHCMVAEAIKALIPTARAVSVDLVTIRFTDPDKRQRYIYLTPLPVQQALVDFDQGRHNDAFRFILAKPVQVTKAGREPGPDGRKTKNPSRAVQGIVGGSGRRQPTKLGGDVPPVGVLSSKGSRRKPGELTAAEKRAVAAAEVPPKGVSAKIPPKRPTAAEKRTAATRKAEAEVAARDRGEPVTKTGSNITLQVTPSRIRKFGMRQLRA